MVSIIIPVYNGENFIKRCLDSIFATEDIPFEVIAVNDGSKDGSLALLQTYAEAHPNLKIVDKVQNEGLPQAKKSGLAAATGDYIAFLDVDDYVDPTIYTRMEEKALASDADIVFVDYIEEYPSRSNVIKSRFAPDQAFPMTGAEAMQYVNHRQAMFTYPWNKLYRAELLRSIEFPFGNFVGEDYYVLIRLLDKAERVDYVDFAGYHYVLTENSMSRGGYGPNTIRAYDYYKEDLAFVCEKHPQWLPDITNYLIVEYMAFVVAMGRNRTYNRQMIREIKSFVRKNLFGFLGARYVPLKMKCSAISLTLSYRLLILAYRLLSR